MTGRRPYGSEEKPSDRRPEEEEGSSLWKRLADIKLGSLIDPTEVGERLSLKPLTISKEVANLVVTQFERSKGEIVALFGREFKRFLDATDVSEEITKALADMTVEVKAEINFKRKTPTENAKGESDETQTSAK